MAHKFQIGDIVRCIDYGGLGTGRHLLGWKALRGGSDIFEVTRLGEKPTARPGIVYLDGRHGSADGAYETRFELVHRLEIVFSRAERSSEYDDALAAQEAYQKVREKR